MELEKLGFTLIIVGMAIVFAAAIAPLLTLLLSGDSVASRGVDVSGGGCIVLFFIPVCFGFGELALHLIIVAAALAVALAIVSLIVYRVIAGSLKPDKAVHI